MLIAWPTLLLQPMTALVVQWSGFTGLWLLDAQATTRGWSEFDLCIVGVYRLCYAAPKWYAQYRFYLSILVGSW